MQFPKNILRNFSLKVLGILLFFGVLTVLGCDETGVMLKPIVPTTVEPEKPTEPLTTIGEVTDNRA